MSWRLLADIIKGADFCAPIQRLFTAALPAGAHAVAS
jgi:hypothetical protein